MEDFHQLLKEQSEKISRLGAALKVIQDEILRNTPISVKLSVGEGAEVLKSLLNT